MRTWSREIDSSYPCTRIAFWYSEREEYSIHHVEPCQACLCCLLYPDVFGAGNQIPSQKEKLVVHLPGFEIRYTICAPTGLRYTSYTSGHDEVQYVKGPLISGPAH